MFHFGSTSYFLIQIRRIKTGPDNIIIIRLNVVRINEVQLYIFTNNTFNTARNADNLIIMTKHGMQEISEMVISLRIFINVYATLAIVFLNYERNMLYAFWHGAEVRPHICQRKQQQ